MLWRMSLSPVLGKSFRSRYKSRSLAEYLGSDCVEAEPIWGHNSLHVIPPPEPSSLPGTAPGH